MSFKKFSFLFFLVGFFLIGSSSVFAGAELIDVWTFNSGDASSSRNENYDFFGCSSTGGIGAVDYSGFCDIISDSGGSAGSEFIDFVPADEGWSYSFWLRNDACGSLQEMWQVPGDYLAGNYQSSITTYRVCSYKGLYGSGDISTNLEGCSVGGGVAQVNRNSYTDCVADEWRLWFVNVKESGVDVYVYDDATSAPIKISEILYNTSASYSKIGGLGFSEDAQAEYDVSDFAIFNGLLTIDDMTTIYDEGESLSRDFFGGSSSSAPEIVVGGDPQWCETDWSTVLETYTTAVACYEAGHFWNNYLNECYETTCYDISDIDYFDFLSYPSDVICDVDLEDEQTEYTYEFDCVSNGGYWYTVDSKCYAMDCDYDDIDILGGSAPTSTVSFFDNYINPVFEHFKHSFPVNYLSSLINFFVVLNNELTTLLDVGVEPFSVSAEVEFYEGESREFDFIDFDIQHLRSETITILGWEFESFYTFIRGFATFVIILSMLFYFLYFVGRLFNN